MCTGIRLIAQNRSVVYARTLEFGQDITSKIVMIPRNYGLVSNKGGSPAGLAWQSKYAVVGANACDVLCMIDGVNEVGLAGGLFYFPEYAAYQQVAHDELYKVLAPWDLMTWILTTCSTVAQVKEVLPTIKVANIVFGPWNMVPPVHAIVHDEQGNSLVIEYVDGRLNMYDNPLGIMTNAPTFDWHSTNLRNYINLSALNVAKVKLGDIVLTPEGQGSGMLGLPGDFTSPSRFIRATAFAQSLIPMPTESQAIDAAFHVLNLFNIPIGVVKEKVSSGIAYDYTQWTGASDLKNRCYYFNTYNNAQLRKVDLMKMDIDGKDPVTINMQQDAAIIDLLVNH